MLTPGQRGDAPTFPALLAGVPAACPVESAAADKAYDSDLIRAALAAEGIEAVIPSLACRKAAIPHDEVKYRERNRVERYFGKLKQFRRVATRYDKLAGTFAAFVHIASVFILIR